MKVLIRILAILVLLGAFLFVAAWAVLSRPAVQLRIARAVLPPEVEIQRVKAGLGGFEVGQGRFNGADGTELVFETARVRMPLLGVFFGRLEIERLELSGFDLRVSGDQAGGPPREEAGVADDSSEAGAARDFYRAISTLETEGYRFSLGEIDISGRITDADGRVFDRSITGGGIAPGATGEVDTRLSLAGSNLRTGLGSMTAELGLALTLDESSVPQALAVTGELNAADTLGGPAAAARFDLEAEIDATARTSGVRFRANGDLPKPVVLLAELEALAGLRFDASLEARHRADRWLLEQGEVTGGLGERRVLAATLEQPLALGETGSGDTLCSLAVTEFPVEWLAPAMPEGFELAGEPVSFELALARDSEDAITLAAAGPIELGPFVVRRGDAVLFGNVTASLVPSFTIGRDGRYRYSIDPLELSGSGSSGLRIRAQGEGAPDSLTVESLAAELRDASGQNLVAAQLVQPLTIGLSAGGPVAAAVADGEIARLGLTGLSSRQLQPLLPEGWRIDDTGITGELTVSGDDGTIRLVANPPLQVSGLSLGGPDGALLDSVDLELPLSVGLADGTLAGTVADARVASGVRRIVSFDAEFSVPVEPGTAGPLSAGLRSEVVLSNLLRQPAFAAHSGLLDGVMQARASYDGAERQLDVAVAIDEFRTRMDPARRHRYNADASLAFEPGGRLVLDGRVGSGFPGRPSSDLAVSGRIASADLPVAAEFEVRGARLDVAEFLALAEGLGPADDAAESPSADPSPDADPTTGSGPPWAGVELDAEWSVDEVAFPNGATAGEVAGSLRVDDSGIRSPGLSAALGDGRFGGAFGIGHDPSSATPYSVTGSGEMNDVRAEFFAGDDAESAPITGGLDGSFALDGRAVELEGLLAAATGRLRVEAHDGLIAGFDLDKVIDEELSSLGLPGGLGGGLARIGIGLAGAQNDYPGIAALTRLVPYFKDIPFEQLVLDLQRGADMRTRVEQLQARGETLALDGTGTIAPASLADLFQAPLDLQLNLSSRGTVTEYVRRLNPELVAASPDAAGYVPWTRAFALTGSLEEVDATSLTDLLWESAIGAIGSDFGGNRSGGDTPASSIERLLQQYLE